MHYETSKFILSSFTIGRFTHIECLPGDHSEVYNQDVCSTVPSWTLKKSTFRGFWAPNAKKWYKIHTTLHLGLWTYHVYSTWALKMYGYNFSCGLRKTKTLKMAIGPTFCGMGEMFVVYEERAHNNSSCWTLVPSFLGLRKERLGLWPPFGAQEGLHFKTRAFLWKPE